MKTKIESMMFHARYAVCTVLLGCGLALLGAASCASAETSTLDEGLEVAPNDPTEQIGESQQADSDNSCTLVRCGFSVKDDCSVSCSSSQRPFCDCQCTTSIFGVCVEYLAICICK